MECNNDPESLLTIIVPLYNEEGNLLRLAIELSNYLLQTPYKAKILFVNDGSTDKSAAIIEQVCTENPLFSFIELKKNGGLSTALKAGIDQVETKLTGYMDADLQTTPFDFDQLMEYTESFELVTGIRLHRKDGVTKRITSTIANAVRNLITHDQVSDTGCPLKILHTSTARRIPLFSGMHRFLPALVQLDGGNVKEVPVRHFQRVAGKSNYQLSNRLIGPLADLIAYIWIRKRYIRYEISAKG
jgi:glycosyltransferase involved in cell wall biosynthesis